MKEFKLVILTLAMLIAASTAALAAEFDWMPDFNIQAQADPSGFRARLATRFQIGDAQIGVVLSHIPDPADAYMAFRLGEMSHRPIGEVVEVYKANRKNGWGAMAKELGIKPGSPEFHALKGGHDFGQDFDKGKKGSGEVKKGGDHGKNSGDPIMPKGKGGKK